MEYPKGIPKAVKYSQISWFWSPKSQKTEYFAVLWNTRPQKFNLSKTRKISVFLANSVGSAVRCEGRLPCAAYLFNLLDNRKPSI